jgi:hypothetical protein
MRLIAVAWSEALQSLMVTPTASTSEVRLDQVESNCRELSSDSKAGRRQRIAKNPCISKQPRMVRWCTGAWLNLPLGEQWFSIQKDLFNIWESLLDPCNFGRATLPKAGKFFLPLFLLRRVMPLQQQTGVEG